MACTEPKAPCISEQRMEELLLFEKISKLHFDDISLLDTALTHSSYANENKSLNVSDNERLEFLGDSVLSISVSDYLYRTFHCNEGEYTRIRSFVVSEDALAAIAKDLSVDNFILVGRGEESTGGRDKKAILADCMEAIFAACYLDKGFEAVKEFILSLLVPEIHRVIENKHKKDYKTLLQEYVQKKFKTIPTYTLIKSDGPDHDQKFYFKVAFHNQTFGPMEGHSKKDAEQNVAKHAWEQLGFE
ncbi:MAG: ribonuclease III [Sphaerochaetaceae bacterium]|nr:ribonuclease III [Sphaerochaetaceae bacterium]MDD4397321.1 ribonuclease III [Sphaerochaetaceae bacterium]